MIGLIAYLFVWFLLATAVVYLEEDELVMVMIVWPITLPLIGIIYAADKLGRKLRRLRG